MNWSTYALIAAVLLAVGVKANTKVAFLFHFFVFGQILPIVAFLLYPVLRVLGVYAGPPNHTVSAVWTDICCRYFQVKFQKLGGELYPDRCMYICPHRSWSDFFVHRKIVDNRGSNLTRWMVLAAFPLFYFVTAVDRSAFWFNRQKARGNSAVFYKFLNDSLNKSDLPSVINYPEGTRNPTSTAKELKRGVVYFAYEYKLPAQVVMSRGNDDLINEKILKMNFGKTVKYKYGSVIKPEDYATRELFFEQVEKEFHALWKELYE